MDPYSHIPKTIRLIYLFLIICLLGVSIYLKFHHSRITKAVLLGDCSQNGVVDVFDLQLLSNSFNKSVGQTGYNANCNFNGDSIVDLFDFQILSNNYGKTATTPTPTGVTPTLPVGGNDYLIMNRTDLMSLPTSGTAWTALKSAADASAGTPDLCNQDNRSHPKVTLASAMVYARTGNQSYADKAKSLILAAYPTQITGCYNAVLSLGRQLGAYVIAADLIKLNDSGFTNWLTGIRTKNIGGHGRWYILKDTSRNSASNWGIFALTSMIAADRYLGDTTSLTEDWKIFSGYGTSFGWPFVKTGSFQEIWSCVPTDTAKSNILPIAINSACTKSGYDLDGAPVEDSSRTTFPTIDNYPAEAAQGFVVQALLLSRAGYNAWGINNSQVKRVALFRERFGNINRSSADYYVTWMTNKVYGLNQPTKPAGYGRIFGFTDWLFGVN